MDHRAGADAFQRFSYGRPGHLMHNTGDGAHAQFQLMRRLQVPLDGPHGQPALFPQGRNQADEIDPQPLPACGHSPEGSPGQPPFPAPRTGPGYEDVFGNFGRRHRKFDDLPGPLHPTPAQGSMAFGAKFRSVDYLPRGFHPRPGKAVGRFLRGFFSSPAAFLRRAAGLWPGILDPGPPPDSRASRFSTRRCSSEITPCYSAITASRVSRLAWSKSNPVSIVPLCHNSAPAATIFQPAVGLRQIRLTKSEQLHTMSGSWQLE